MVHYPSQIMKYGPLIYSWTMRYEAKLSVIKSAASHGNFKNICYTVAKRSLHAFCYYLNCERFFLAVQIEVSNVPPEVQLANESEELRRYFSGINPHFSLRSPNWIKFGPLFLKKFSYVFLGCGDLYPCFGKVIDLYSFTVESTSTSKFVIRIKKCDTLYFDSHFNAYAISVISPPIFVVLELASLPFYPILHAHKSFNGSETYIVLKRYVM